MKVYILVGRWLVNRGYPFSALVLPNFTYGLSVYGAVDPDLTVIQNFLDRCFKRKYTSKRTFRKGKIPIFNMHTFLKNEILGNFKGKNHGLVYEILEESLYLSKALLL